MKPPDVCPPDCPGRHAGCHAECPRYLACRRESLERYKQQADQRMIDDVQYTQARKTGKRGG